MGAMHPPPSTTALNLLVNGSYSPLASTTTLGTPADGSNAARVGEATPAGAAGNNRDPNGNGALGNSSIHPTQQSAFYPIIQQGNVRLGWLLAMAASGGNETNILTKNEGGLGMTPLKSQPPVALATMPVTAVIDTAYNRILHEFIEGLSPLVGLTHGDLFTKCGY